MEPRDLMAPDTEPTDEELALVIRAANETVLRRKVVSDAWISARLEECTRIAIEHSQRLLQGKDCDS